MKTTERKIFEYIRSSDNAFIIPPYQRTYNWEIDDVKKLINDVSEWILKPLAERQENKTYYIGNLLTKRRDDSWLTLIDGQQRITTCILIAKTLHRFLNKLDEDRRYTNLLVELQSVFYYNETEKKIKLNNLSDLHVLENIINNASNAKDDSTNFSKNYEYLCKFFSKLILEDIVKWINAFNKLVCIVIELDKEENEHLVFESINSKGKRLLQSDLIKNYIFFLCNDNKEISNYYNDKFLKNFRNTSEELDFFRMFECCTLDKAPESKNGTKIYESIKKKYDKNNTGHPIFNIDELIELKEFLSIYKFVKNLKLSLSCSYIVNCAFSTYFPWIYKIINKRRNQINFIENNEEFIVEIDKSFNNYIDEHLKIISTYDILRVFGGYHRAESAKSVHTIPDKIEDYCCAKKIDFYNCSLQDKINFFYESGNIKAFTIPQSFDDDILKIDMFSESQRLKAILWLYESNMRKIEKINWDEFVTNYKTIEHILPKNAKNNDEWIHNLGNNLDDSYKKLNTIGNLTVLGPSDNSIISDDCFDKKKEAYRCSHLGINRQIAEYNEWNINSIIDRANRIKQFIEREMIV